MPFKLVLLFQCLWVLALAGRERGARKYKSGRAAIMMMADPMRLRGHTGAVMTTMMSKLSDHDLLEPTEVQVLQRRNLQKGAQNTAAPTAPNTATYTFTTPGQAAQILNGATQNPTGHPTGQGQGQGMVGGGGPPQQAQEQQITIYEEVPCITAQEATNLTQASTTRQYVRDDSCLQNSTNACPLGCCRVVESQVFCDTTNVSRSSRFGHPWELFFFIFFLLPPNMRPTDFFPR